MVSLKYALTKDDYISYYSYVTWDAPENNKKRRNFYFKQIITPLIFLFIVYYSGLFDRMGKFTLLIIGFLFFTFILSFISVRSNIKKQAEKVTDDPDNSSIFSETIVEISDAGIHTKDDLTEVKFHWNAFIKKMESDEYYFLFYNALQAILIPKRVFRSAEDKILFEKLLSQHLSFDAEISHLLKS